jgi:MATE family multidrug resistance protein
LVRTQRELLRLSWPVTVSMLSVTTMTLVDTLLVARLGKEALAGVGLGGTIAYTLIAFGIGLAMGGKTLVAQAVGAGKRDELGGYLGASLLVEAALGLLVIVLTLPVAALVGRFTATPLEGQHFATYVLIRSFGAPSNLVFAALRESRYGQGDSRSPMFASVVANSCNAVLGYLFIFPLGLGVAGAAWATVIAQTVEPMILAAFQHRAGWGVTAVRPAHIAALVRIGSPSGLQSLLELISFAILATMIAALGPAQMAAHQIALQIIAFSFMPAWGVSEAAAVLVGQAIGAARDDLVLPVFGAAARVVTAYATACTLCFALFAHSLIAAFTQEAEVRTIGVRLLYAASLFLIVDGIGVVGRGALRGAGDVRFPAWVGVVLSWLLTPPLAWLLGWRLGLGAFGGWVGITAQVFAYAAIMSARVRLGHWRPHAERTRAEMLSVAAA